MKKLFAILALAGLMTACNNKSKTEDKKPEDTTTTTTTTTNDNNTTTTTTTTSDIPKFSDPEVQKWAEDYTVFVTAYVDAYRTKDASKIATVGTQAMDWAQRTSSMTMKLANNPDEAKKLSDYLTVLSQRMQDAVKGMQ